MTTADEVLALIPARGGSKSIPRKNLLNLGGKPLVAYSIEQALASRHITRVIVSTEDDEIAAVAQACGAEVPVRRPDHLAADEATDLDVFRHMLAALRDGEGYACDLVVHLRPTGPVRRVETIDHAIELIRTFPDADSLRSVSPALQTPYKMWRPGTPFMEPVMAIPGQPDSPSQPRQSLPETYWQNGYVDVVRPRTLFELHSMTGRRVLPLLLDEEPLELDYPESIPRVEAAVLSMQRGQWPSALPRRHAV